MDHTSFYAFDFVASEDRLDKYYQEMKAQQPLGPYTLMGYSAGTNLAFEMVQYLEAKGEVVRDLILIDGGIRLAEHTETAEEVAASIQNVIDSIHETPQFKVIKELMTAPSTGAQVLNRMRVYFEYSNTLVNEGTIQSNIHLLLSSEEMKGEDTRLLWGDYTEGKFLKYTGQGEHIAMLNSPNLERNVAIIQQMLIGMKREKKMRN